jgi:two-component sensor histidine kinase
MSGEPPAVLVLAPLAGDARALNRLVGEFGHPARICRDDRELHSALAAGDPIGEAALFVVVTEEGAGPPTGEALQRISAREPNWSRLPIVFLTGSAATPPPAYRMLLQSDAAAACVLLQRPVNPRVLASVFRTQIEARRRQFETRALIDSLEAAERRKAFLLSEVRHRTRNSLSVLHSLFSLTARRHTELDSFVSSFEGRIRTLAEAHGALAYESGRTQALVDLAAEHVRPYCALPDQLELSGPPVYLTERAAVDFAMLVHELATNAAKYGALSVLDGIVTLSWTRQPDDGPLAVTWTERGGPPVTPPERRGLGSQLLESVSVCGHAVGTLDYRPAGLVWRIALPPEALLSD